MHVWEHSSTAFFRLVSSEQDDSRFAWSRTCASRTRLRHTWARDVHQRVRRLRRSLTIVLFAWAAETLKEERRAPASLGA